MANLYERIAELCEERGITPYRLAAELGVSRSIFTDLKMGRKKVLTTETLAKIAGYFGVPAGDLLGEAGEGDPSTQFSRELIAAYGDTPEHFSADDIADIAALMKIIKKRKDKE